MKNRNKTILQVGYPRSGNFWLYNIIQSILKSSGRKTPSYIQNHPIYPLAKSWNLSPRELANIDVLDIEKYQCFASISSVFRTPIENLDDYISKCSQVWSHSEITSEVIPVFEKFHKVIYIIRHPLDAIISAAHFAFTPYISKYFPHHQESNLKTYLESRESYGLTQRLKGWKQHVGGFLRFRSRLPMHIIFYERLLCDFDHELTKLLGYLELTLNKKKRSNITEAVHFKTMKKKNPFHIRKGKFGQWKENLTDSQVNEARQIVGQLCSFLNYQIKKEYPLKHIDIQELPRVPKNTPRRRLDSALKNHKTTQEKVQWIRNILMN